MTSSLAITFAVQSAQLLADPVAHGPWGAGPWGTGFSPWFLLFPLFWILVIGLLIFFARRTWRRNHEWATARGGESVLRERYARGEIDETEYRQRLEVLRGDSRRESGGNRR
jgi:putative membrane protein